MQLTMRCHHEDHDAPSRDAVERRLRLALGRFSPQVGRVAIVFSDDNGPRGGRDKRCRAIVGLLPGGRVTVEVTDESYAAALARVVDRASRCVGRELDRRRWRKGWLSASGQAT